MAFTELLKHQIVVQLEAFTWQVRLVNGLVKELVFIRLGKSGIAKHPRRAHEEEHTGVIEKVFW